jgi:hypothetical protein
LALIQHAAVSMSARWWFLFVASALACSSPAAQVKFAIIGDYGNDSAGELAVANLVKTNFQPAFVVTVGENNYLGEDLIDRAIGNYHHFIGNYQGTFGSGASSNRFFPALDITTGTRAAATRSRRALTSD